MPTYRIHVNTTFEIEAKSKIEAIDKVWKRHGIYEYEIDGILEEKEKGEY